MFLFIFESIGTSELLLVGIVALIFLGPRKMPEMARKIGKIMAEFRGTANEFKETWQREANFDAEIKALDLNALEAEAKPVARVPESVAAPEQVSGSPAIPAIKAADPAKFEHLLPKQAKTAESSDASADENDKRNWL